MKNSARTLNIFVKNYVKNLSKHAINLTKGQNDMKHKKQIMTEITGKSRLNSNRFLKSIKVNGKAIKKNSNIAEEFY